MFIFPCLQSVDTIFEVIECLVRCKRTASIIRIWPLIRTVVMQGHVRLGGCAARADGGPVSQPLYSGVALRQNMILVSRGSLSLRAD